MSTEIADFIVIGAGIAGASVAYELSLHGKVVVLEMESAAGYHSTGRSAAVMSENYGPALWSRLVTASRAFLETPPDGFASVPLVTPRGALFLAREHEQAKLATQADELRRRGATIELATAEEALRFCPVIKATQFASALYEPDCKDIDTDALLSGYLRVLRSRGGQLITSGKVTGLKRSAGVWKVSTPTTEFEAPVVVNAAGGWVQEIASLAGFSYRNVVPFRRTAVVFDPPAGSSIHTWPMTFDVAETFYFKPEAGRIMVSPVDMSPSEPCDAQADELEVAIAIDRIETFTTMEVRTVKHKWGGLRTFAPDHEPVIGSDPEERSFIWLAGQGGNGVMAGAAAARLAASFALGADIPSDIAALGITPENVSPGRTCVMDDSGTLPVVGNLESLE
ncbi:NAD(P)/FAD-dependent oxidoreductase [Rhizobium leguminosarum]|uniref:NAD(P)/FAD-dependent oxidoreductase n=1 Tax=Rhizobium leguminosarum TaxID=384 RepID=UPI001C96C1AB|nr:FAD-dependent oxidoreductase [Rhizobium leguminosarum]MBY5406821.1 FAD-binding oxidoreductase [Rhizobium leguminosarum]